MNTFLWLVRREFWENRAIWMIPSALGALMTLAALFGRVDIEVAGADQNYANVEMAVLAFVAVFCAAMALYSTWYLLDCLYSDRKDRSVLFWKSLPISDTATVLSKLFLALVAVPLVYFLVADVTALLLAFIVSLRTHWQLGGAPWQPALWFDLQVLWLYMIASGAVWYLPLAGALLVLSAWAKRAVLLWSTLLPIAVILAERWFFNSHVVATLLQTRISGYFTTAFHGGADGGLGVSSVGGPGAVGAPRTLLALLDPVAFLSSTATWTGALAGAVLIAGAIQLRMRRTES